MLNHNIRRISVTKGVCCLIVVCFGILHSEVNCCSPGRSGARRRSARKLTPLVFKQHVPNVSEHSIGASGPPEGRIKRDDPRFKNLIPNYNADIVFKDEEGTGVDRLMTRLCQEKLDMLAISVMNMWPGVRLRVTEGFDEDGAHPKTSLHYEGRAVAISTSDRDTSKYGMLARLAVDAGFDWVFYESRAHIYCSVKTESTSTSRFSGCFPSSSTVTTRSGTKPMNALKINDEILSSGGENVLSYSKIIGFLHRDPHLTAKFVQLTTSSNDTLVVTPDHLVFTKDGEVHHASDLEIGDTISTASVDSVNGGYCSGFSTVTSKTYENLQGVYAPLTEAGTIVVDGVVCSCYAIVGSHNLAHVLFYPLRKMHQWKRRFSCIARLYELIGDILRHVDSSSLYDAKRGNIHWYARLLCDIRNFVNNDVTDFI